jgi:hypothetical protein
MGANTNFATWDSRHYQGGSGSTTTFSFGNCRVGTTSGGYPLQYSNFAFPATGKYYIELNNIVNNNYHVFGISRQINIRYGDGLLNQTGSYQYQAWNGKKRGNGGSEIAYGSSWTSVGDVIGLAFDADNGKIWWAKNGTWQASGNPAAGSNEAFSGLDASETYYFGWADYYTSKAGTVHINCGQDSSFSDSKTSGSANATDSNGFGDFYYTPPTGFLALGSASVPVSDDIDPAQTDTDYSGKQFNVVTYTGNSSTNAVTGLNLQPDLLWVKKRSAAGTNYLSDTSRGINKFMFSNGNDAEQTGGGYASIYSAFGTDGFTLGSSSTGPNDSGATYVAWGWRANGGTTATNTEGATNSTVQANTKAGFSIIQYVGTGSNTTIGHGLDTAPDFMIHKNRDTTDNWVVYSRSQGASKRAQLNSNIAWGTSTGSFNSTDPSSTLITLGSSSGTNASSGNYVCYAWHSVEGFSKFGSYEGNANDNGPFVYTGFRPRMLWIKEADNADDWVVYDTARSTSNPVQKVLRYETNVVEFDGTGRAIDILSNGFKIRTSNNTINQSSTFAYGCFGDVPFKYNNTF